MPPAPVFRERPLKLYDPEYVEKLLADAVNNHGFTSEAADLIIAGHLQDVVEGQAKRVTSWKELSDGIELDKRPTHLPSSKQTLEASPVPVSATSKFPPVAQPESLEGAP